MGGGGGDINLNRNFRDHEKDLPLDDSISR